MIPFFRKIRKKMADDNKPLKYMRYAIGEIVLVVVGILIALQINNWNEEKKTQQRLSEFLIEIQNDLSNDIIEANHIIDEYITNDSILRNIKNNKVVYTLDNHTETRKSFDFIFNYPKFKLQTKGYDGLINNIDNIPIKYRELMRLLNLIYVSNNYELTTVSERVQSNSYINRDNLNNKGWSSDFWDWKVNDTIIEYFQSKEYINKSRNYFKEYAELILQVIKFKIVAIDAYNDIVKLNNSKTLIPEHVNYTFPDLELLTQFTGDFQRIHAESADTDDKIKFEIEDNQLQWHYTYKDVNYDEEFNVPLFWHSKNIFFIYQSSGIWEFGKTTEGVITFKHRANGSEDRHLKK